MLLRFAKLAGGLRLLIATAAPLVVTSASLLSVRTAAYLVGFGLGSILSIWLPVVLTLVSLTGVFGGNTDTSVCDAYRAEIKAINDRNAVKIADCEAKSLIYKPIYDAWWIDYLGYFGPAYEARKDECVDACNHAPCGPDSGETCGFSCYYCNRRVQEEIDAAAPKQPDPPVCQELETWGNSDGCGSESPPDCPAGKKVWLQVLWASPRGNASDSKGCFIVAYSQDSPDLPANIEYNPFLKEQFVKSRAAAYDSITGNKLIGVDTTQWEDLDSRKGWDKGYWAAEVVDTECRGCRPGWSLKIK